MKRNNINRCRNLRKNQTEAERNLWSTLRSRQLNGVKFRRQFPLGRYILDFYSPEYKVGIEADGGGHYQNKGRQRDEARKEELSQLGVMILRFNDLEILNNIEGVCEVIQKSLRESVPSPHSSPRWVEEVIKKCPPPP